MSRLSTRIHPLLTEAIIEALFSKNIFTTVNFIQTENKQLVLLTNLTFKNILLLKKHIINKNSALTRNGLEYYNQFTSNSAIISTGITSIDALLEGGLATGNIYELCGLPGCGKTQFCLTLSKNVVQNLHQCIYYLDTKGDFNAKRIKNMLEANEIDEMEIGEVMTKILVKKLNTKFDLINALYAIKNELNSGLKIRLIIIDSLPPLFYQYSDIPRCNGILNHAVNIMRFLAVEYYVVFVVTNILITWYDGGFGVDNVLTEKIGCGKYWLTVPNTRLKISKTTEELGERCEVEILKTSKLSKGRLCNVGISECGMV